MPSRRDQVRKSDSRKSGKSEQDQSDQEEQPPKPQKGSGKQKNQQQQRGNDRGRADGQEDDPCGRQQQQQQQQGSGQKQQNQGQRHPRGQYQQEETINELNNCVKCGEETTAGQVITMNGRKWHPECFTCGGCCVILAKVSFFLDGDRIYCPSCWAKNVKSNCSVSSSALPVLGPTRKASFTCHHLSK